MSVPVSKIGVVFHQAGVKVVFTVITELKPNSITLASSELAPNMFEAVSCQIPLH